MAAECYPVMSLLVSVPCFAGVVRNAVSLLQASFQEPQNGHLYARLRHRSFIKPSHSAQAATFGCVEKSVSFVVGRRRLQNEGVAKQLLHRDNIEARYRLWSFAVFLLRDFAEYCFLCIAPLENNGSALSTRPIKTAGAIDRNRGHSFGR